MFPLLLVLKVATLALSQTTHTVSVGVQGSVFDPPTIAAGINDTVTFLFLGDVHTVTQSTLDSPCSPLQGGFSSNFFGRGPNFTDPTVTWSLTVTNTTNPIWFYCAVTRPVSHCEQGMVGAINPPSQDTFTQFQRAAKAVTSVPPFSPSLVLQGVGATASMPVTLTSATVPPPTSAPIVTTSSSTAMVVPPSPTTTPMGPSHTAVIGGAVGGALGGIILVLLGLIIYFRLKKRSKSTPSEPPYVTYDSHPLGSAHGHSLLPTGPGMPPAPYTPGYITAFDVDHDANALMHKQSLMRATSVNTLTSNHSHLKTHNPGTYPLQPQRYVDANSVNYLGGRNATAQGLETIYDADVGSPVHPRMSMYEGTSAEGPIRRYAPSTTHSAPSENVDIHALAKEVAAVLQKEKKTDSDANHEDPAGATGSNESVRSAPPKYRAVNN